MPTSDALTGFGVPPQVAQILGANPSKILGTGTAQVGATKILTKNVEITAAAGAQAAILGDAFMEPYFIANTAATAVAALIFVPSGHTVVGSLNGSVSVPQNKGAIIWQYKPKFWAAVVSA